MTPHTNSIHTALSTSDIAQLCCSLEFSERSELDSAVPPGVQLIAFDGVQMRERVFVFADEGDAIEAEIYLSNEPSLFGVHRPSPLKRAGTEAACRAAVRARPVVEDANPEDLRQIVSIDLAQWGRMANPLPLYRQLLDLYPSAVKVARGVIGELLGFGVGLINHATAEGWALSIDIAEQYRGCGAGKVLAVSMIEEFERGGCTHATAIISPDNDASMNLFRSLEFRPVEVLRDYFGPGTTQLRFRRTF